MVLQVLLDARQYRALADNAIKWLAPGPARERRRRAGDQAETGVITRRAALVGAGALAVPAQAQDLRTLKTIAAAKGFVFGSAAAC